MTTTNQQAAATTSPQQQTRAQQQAAQLAANQAQAEIAAKAQSQPGGGINQPQYKAVDTSKLSPAQLALRQYYGESGVIFDSKGNVLYNPTDLGAEEIEQARAAQGLPPSQKDSGTISPQYQQSVYEASKGKVVNLESTSKALDIARNEKIEAINLTKRQIAAAQKLFDTTTGPGLGSAGVGQGYLDSIRADQKQLARQQAELQNIEKARIETAKNVISARHDQIVSTVNLLEQRAVEPQKNVLGAEIETHPIAPQSPRIQATTNVPGKLFGNPDYITREEQAAIDSTKPRKKEFLSTSKRLEASLKRNEVIKRIKAGTATPEEVSVFGEVNKTLGLNPLTGNPIEPSEPITPQRVRPHILTNQPSNVETKNPVFVSESVFTAPEAPPRIIPQNNTASIFGIAPDKPRKLTPQDIESMTPQEIENYNKQVAVYNEYVGYAQKQYLGQKEAKTILRQSNKENYLAYKNDIKSFVDQARQQGTTTITITTKQGQVKTVPIERAVNEILKTKDVENIGLVPAIPVGYVPLGGHLEGFPSGVLLQPKETVIKQDIKGNVTVNPGEPIGPKIQTNNKDVLSRISSRAQQIAENPNANPIQKFLAGAGAVGLETVGGFVNLEQLGGKAFADFINNTGNNGTNTNSTNNLVGGIEITPPETIGAPVIGGLTTGIKAAAATKNIGAFTPEFLKGLEQAKKIYEKQGPITAAGNILGYTVPFGGSPVAVERAAFEVIPEAGLKSGRFVVKATEAGTGKTISASFKDYTKAQEYAAKLEKLPTAETVKITASQETIKSLSIFKQPIISKVSDKYVLGNPIRAPQAKITEAVQNINPTGRGLELGTQTKYSRDFLTSEKGLTGLEQVGIILPRDVEAVKLAKQAAKIINDERGILGEKTYPNLKGLESLKSESEQNALLEQILPKSKVPIKGSAAQIVQVRGEILNQTPRAVTGDIDRDFALMKFFGKVGLGKIAEKYSVSQATKDVKKAKTVLEEAVEKEGSRLFEIKGTKLYSGNKNPLTGEIEDKEKVLENLTHKDVEGIGSTTNDFTQVFGVKYKYDIVKAKSPKGKNIKFRSLSDQTLTKLTSSVSLQGPRTEKFVGEGTPDFLKSEIQTTEKGFTVIAPESRLKDVYDLLNLDLPEITARLAEKGRTAQAVRLGKITEEYKKLYPEIDFSTTKPIIEKDAFETGAIPSRFSRAGITPNSVIQKGTPAAVFAGSNPINKNEESPIIISSTPSTIYGSKGLTSKISKAPSRYTSATKESRPSFTSLETESPGSIITKSPVKSRIESRTQSRFESSRPSLIESKLASPIKSPTRSPVSPIKASPVSPFAESPASPITPSPTSPILPSPISPFKASPVSPIAPSPVKPLEFKFLKTEKVEGFLLPKVHPETDKTKGNKITQNDFVGNVSDVEVTLGFNRKEITTGIERSAKRYKKDNAFAYKYVGAKKFVNQKTGSVLKQKKELLFREKPKVVARNKKKTGGFY